MKKNKSVDCRSQEGTVIGLIDSIISISRVLPAEIKKLEKQNFGELPDAAIHAFHDLLEDPDFLYVLRRVHSRYVIDEYRADLFDTILNSNKGKTIVI